MTPGDKPYCEVVEFLATDAVGGSEAGEDRPSVERSFCNVHHRCEPNSSWPVGRDQKQSKFGWLTPPFEEPGKKTGPENVIGIDVLPQDDMSVMVPCLRIWDGM